MYKLPNKQEKILPGQERVSKSRISSGIIGHDVVDFLCPGISFALSEDFFHDEGMDMFEITRLSNAVVMTAVRKGAPDLTIGLADSKKLCHVGRTRKTLRILAYWLEASE